MTALHVTPDVTPDVTLGVRLRSALLGVALAALVFSLAGCSTTCPPGDPVIVKVPVPAADDPIGLPDNPKLASTAGCADPEIDPKAWRCYLLTTLDNLRAVLLYTVELRHRIEVHDSTLGPSP